MNLINSQPSIEEEKSFRKGQFLIRYIISGVSSVVIQFAALSAMVELLELNPTLSSGIAYLIGCFVNYLMLYFWTFQSKAKHTEAIVKYFIVTSCTLVINLILFWVMVEVLQFWYLFSQVCATVLVAVLNMIIFKLYTFAEPKIEPKQNTEFPDER